MAATSNHSETFAKTSVIVSGSERIDGETAVGNVTTGVQTDGAWKVAFHQETSIASEQGA
jgi:hypothetical protein